MVPKREQYENRFRAANERLHTLLGRFPEGGPMPFLCECPDPTCMGTVALTRAQYERLAGVPGQVVVRLDHRNRVAGPVVDEGGDYVVVADERPTEPDTGAT